MNIWASARLSTAETCRMLTRDVTGDGRQGPFRPFSRPSPQGAGDDGFSEIAISAGIVRSGDVLISTMAHEMIHLYQHETGTVRGHHNPKFRKPSVWICAIHGFDLEIL